jgi:hypothetical protein
LVQVYFKRFRKVIWRTRRSKRLSATSRKKSHLAFQKMKKEYYGTKGMICVPIVKELKNKILHEAHEFAYSINLGGNKIYHDLKGTYWWYGMETSLGMSLFATLVNESRLNINNMLDCCSLCKCLNGSGKRLP